MSKTSSNDSGWRDKVLESILGKIVDKSFDALLALLIWVGVPAVLIGWFFRSTVAVPVWVFAALCAATLGLGAAVIVLRRRLQRVAVQSTPGPAKFEAFPAEDRRLHLGWKVLMEPRLWIETDLSHVSPAYVQQILDGPFHIREGCHERLAVFEATRRNPSGPLLDQRCPGCGRMVFDPGAPPWWWDVRAEAVLELQRLHRLGKQMAAPAVVLESPRYWKYLAPPPPPVSLSL